MDEPLSALDYRRRQEILPYLERLRAELAIPRIYVSHAPEEVARLADHLIVVDDGRVQASGSLSESLLLARMTRRAAALLGIAPGKLFWVQVKSVMLLH